MHLEWYMAGLPIQHSFSMIVECAPTTHPLFTQRCEAHRQSLYQPFGHVYPLSPSPSPISFYITAVHSSRNTFRHTPPLPFQCYIPAPHISTALSERTPRPLPFHHLPRVVYRIAIPYTNHSAIHTSSPPVITHQFLYTRRPLIPRVIERSIPFQLKFRGPTPLQKRFIVVYPLSPFLPHKQNGIPAPTLTPSTQCCVLYRQCLHQSFGLLFPPAPCPSPINCYIPALHSSRNAFRVVHGWPAHPTFILNDVPSYHSICYFLIAVTTFPLHNQSGIPVHIPSTTDPVLCTPSPMLTPMIRPAIPSRALSITHQLLYTRGPLLLQCIQSGIRLSRPSNIHFK
ncbi:hypothetical protein T12_4682 [Trichinella patagoniensis]|uniref:Uncharacterized protein n=1 Tax=Trichinella patagoniensis TaxID=990121 RepID=A0A0V0Z6G2_9BILA|nr:hypothetical protein T12_6029 [Trichinella patagoniensis]KRY18343.1 hypothetical protein T12_4682 [Trichinella patagoniensis]